MGYLVEKSFPDFETASSAIINAIECLTAFVPQVGLDSHTEYKTCDDTDLPFLGITGVCCSFVDERRKAYGCSSSFR